MLRLLHTADVHLGARHTDLGDRASLQRERQFAAFRATIDLAIAEGVDLVLIAGDLFDSNTQPRRSVERVAAELERLVRASIRTAIIPGTHDLYDGASIYRAYDLAALSRSAGDWVVVLSPDRPEAVFPSLDAIVYGRVFDTKRAPRSPLAGLDAGHDSRATWQIGMVHGALAIPGRTDGDEVVFSEAEIAVTGLDYLALGHWHSRLQGTAGNTVYAYPGAPEPVAVDQDGAGDVLLVECDDRMGLKRVTVRPHRVGQTRCESIELDLSGFRGQPALVDALARRADPNLILDVRLAGFAPDDLDLDLDEVERELAASFLRLRVRDHSIPGAADEPLPPAETVLGAFIRIVEDRIEARESGLPPGVAAGVADGDAEQPPAGAPEPAAAPVTAEAGDAAPLDGEHDPVRHQAAPSGAEAGPAADAASPRDAPASEDELSELREVLRLGRHLLEGRQVTL